jgi:CTP:molybdopterin cytidylyltransferase MocA
MHGLILAAGEGSRLAADGVASSKRMVEVCGRPQLPHLVETLERLRCETITCMVPESEATDLSHLPAIGGADHVGVHGCRTSSSLHTLALGLGTMSPGMVFCTMVDTVMRDLDWIALAAAARALIAAGSDLVLAVTPYLDDERPLYVLHDYAGNVRDLSDEPSRPVSVTGGVYVLNDRAREAAREAVGRGVRRLRGFLRECARGSLDVRSVAVSRIIDLDRGRDLAAANAWLAGATIQ